LDGAGRDAAHVAIVSNALKQSARLQIVDMMLTEFGLDICASPNSPFRKAAATSQCDIMQLIIDKVNLPPSQDARTEYYRRMLCGRHTNGTTPLDGVATAAGTDLAAVATVLLDAVQAHCPDTCVSGTTSGTLFYPLDRAIVRGNADAVRLFLRRCPMECVLVAGPRSVTVAHYLALRGSEPVIRAAHELFHTEAVLEGKWAAMLACRGQSKGMSGPMYPADCLASRTDLGPEVRELFVADFEAVRLNLRHAALASLDGGTLLEDEEILRRGLALLARKQEADKLGAESAGSSLEAPTE
jgi:hypothetical protein